MGLKEWRLRVKEYNAIATTGPIIRRYFVIGAFDGALTILGLILGASAAGVTTPQADLGRLVILTGLAATVGLTVSSGVGAYEAERVERRLDLHSLERAMLRQMGESHGGAFAYAAWISALVHGVSPMVAAIPPLLPFVFLPFPQAVAVAIVIALGLLFVMGAFLGRLVKERFLATGFRFVLAGLVTAIILYVVGRLV